MDAGAHAISGAELRHPDEHVDAEFLRPGEVDLEQVWIKKGNIDEKTMSNRDEGNHRRGAHQGRDDGFLKPVENAQQHRWSPRRTRGRTKQNEKRIERGPDRSIVRRPRRCPPRIMAVSLTKARSSAAIQFIGPRPVSLRNSSIRG